MASDSLSAIKQTFFQECEEQLSELENGLLQLDNGDHSLELIGAVFRAVHSIKGGAAAFGFDELVSFVHVFETVLDRLRAGKLAPSAAVSRLLLRAADVLADLVRLARDGGEADSSDVDQVMAQLKALEGDGAAAAPEETQDDSFGFTPVAISLDDIFATADSPPTQRFEINFKPNPGLYARANEALRVLRELSALGDAEISCDCSQVPLLPDIDPEGAYFSWRIILTTEASQENVAQVFDFVVDDCALDISLIEHEQAPAPPPPASVETAPAISAAPIERSESVSREDERSADSVEKGEPRAQAAAPTIRVDLDKVDRLINLVGELVITRAALSLRVTEAGLSRASSVVTALDELEQLTRDIQDSVMSIRAQPVRPMFQRMSRTVREACALTGKSVRLVVDGEGTEVDKTVIERLTDPLTHMVRNAVDHGVEDAETRLAAGKAEEGVLRLSAAHRSGRILIEIADDGAGINRQRVREIAESKGLVAPDAHLTDDEIDNLIFLPGFSTVSVASNISGRGVGMDVVKRAIQDLGGRISISSAPGRGSTFSLSVPLTLAVLDGMVVSVADQTLIIPLTAIIETLQPNPSIVHTLASGCRIISNRKSFLPLIDIACALGYRMHEVDATAQVALLVESEGGLRCALLVDAIQGQRQVVIKSLEANYGRVPGVAAATILGDGRVALIVDLDTILGRFKNEAVAPDFGVYAAE